MNPSEIVFRILYRKSLQVVMSKTSTIKNETRKYEKSNNLEAIFISMLNKYKKTLS
jgi:hypothetical protein